MYNKLQRETLGEYFQREREIKRTRKQSIKYFKIAILVMMAFAVYTSYLLWELKTLIEITI